MATHGHCGFLAAEIVERPTGIEPVTSSLGFFMKFDVFLFQSKNLVKFLRLNNHFPICSSFNYFRTLYFCLGMVVHFIMESDLNFIAFHRDGRCSRYS